MRNVFIGFFCVASALGLAACTLITAGKLEQAVTSCNGVADGTPCTTGDYCFAGNCTFSFCGDGIANTNRGEECDDGNLLPDDGCEPPGSPDNQSCKFSCDAETACPDDGNPCNGPESCSADTHSCLSGPNAGVGTPCLLVGGGDGACSEGYCVPPGCGDGSVLGAEECEPPDYGCLPDCTWECTSNDDCPSSDFCEGLRACDVNTHSCYDVVAPDCADADPCTADACDPNQGCRNAAIDADRDGYSPFPACGLGSTLLPGDCDDTDAPGVYPGAPEQCGNNIDDDCDGQIDETSTTEVNCLYDGDKDGYGDPSNAVSGCSCPAGYVPARGENDCNDMNPSVHPNLQEWEYFITPYCPDGYLASGYPETGFFCSTGEPSFDFDCDGNPLELQYADVFAGCTAFSCTEAGWADGVPDCGQSGTIYYCSPCGGVESAKAPIPPPDPICLPGSCDVFSSYYNPQGCR